VQVVAFALKHAVLLDVDLHIEVACRTAALTVLAFAREADAVAFVDTLTESSPAASCST
jgi:hypothetical protein